MKKIMLRTLLALFLLEGAWLGWWIFLRSPEAQVRAAQANLIDAVEKRDWTRLEKLLYSGYTDAYGHNRDSAIQDGRKYFSGFFTLTLHTDKAAVRAAKGQGMVTTMIRLEGNGVGYSQIILGHLNQLATPWVFHWSNPGRWPWDWTLSMIHNDQLHGAVYGTP
jgi:hypothetical protein